MIESEWMKAKVIKGYSIGKKIGVSTVNLDNPHLMVDFSYGVYQSEILIAEKIYKGSLYYGPRTIDKSDKIVLEIHLFDFDQNLYGQEISFRLLRFIRSPVVFKNLFEMKKTIEEDNRRIKSGRIQ